MTEKREIKIGVMSYLDANKMQTFGTMGQTVEVHADDLERFDRYNSVPGDESAAAGSPAVDSLEAATQAEEAKTRTSRRTTTRKAKAEDERPADDAPRTEWVAYAKTQGITDEADLKGMDAAAIRDMLD